MRNEDGTFAPGWKGKPKAAKNKVTQDIRRRFQQIVENNLNTLEADLKALEPKDRINAIIGLAPFFVPKLASVSVQTTARKEIIKIEVITSGKTLTELEHGADNNQDRLIEE